MNTAVLDKSQPGRDGTVACGASAPQDASCPLVSIVVPVWNVKQFLPVCLNSIQAQTLQDWECILVDDGTTDGSGQICDEYAARDSRFKVIHQKNGGVCAARNAGIRVARGKYLTFSDDDDRIYFRELEWAVAAMQAETVDFVCWRCTWGDKESCKGTSKEARRRYVVDDSEFIHHTMYWVIWNKLFDRQKLLQANIWFDETWYNKPQYKGEDDDFLHRLFAEWGKQKEVTFSMLDEVMYFWNDTNRDSQSRSFCEKPEEQTEKWQKNYWDKLYPLMARHQSLYPDDKHAWPRDLQRMRLSYLKQLAYGLCCAKANGEKTPPLGRCKELTALLNSCKAEKTWSPYYLPFRLRQKWLVRFLYHLDESGNRNFGRMDWGFYYLLGGKWNR